MSTKLAPSSAGGATQGTAGSSASSSGDGTTATSTTTSSVPATQVETAKSAGTAETARPVETAKPAETAETARPVETAKPAETAEPATPTDASKPAKSDAETIASLQARLDALEAESRANAGQAQLVAKRAYLQGIVSEEVLQLTPKVELARDGTLTDASRRTLDQWRADRPHFFGRAADADNRGTPTTAEQFTAAELAQLKAQGVDTSNARRVRNLAIITQGVRGAR